MGCFIMLDQMILSQISLVDPWTTSFCIFLILFAIVFPIIRNILRKKGKSLTVWNICAFIPLAVCCVHLIFNLYDGNELKTFSVFGPAYITSVLFPILIFFRNKKILFHISAVINGLLVVCLSVFSFYNILFSGPALRNYSYMSYTDSYKNTIEFMKSTYVNSDWKKIDYDAINEEILPLVEKAEKENDPAGYYAALMKLSYLIPDGHVLANTDDMDIYTEAADRVRGNDYGFIMFQLSDGKTEAFLVDEDIKEIKNGTVITSWDGVPIDKALENNRADNMDTNFPVADNEKFFNAISLAGKGGDKITVGYIDEDGKEKSIELKSRGSYSEKQSIATGILGHAYFPDPMHYLADNFSTKMLTDKIGYMKIINEDLEDYSYSYFEIEESKKSITNLVKERVNALKSQGMEKLIIDLRNNSGGYGHFPAAITSAFTDSTDIIEYEDGSTYYNGLKIPVHLSGDGSFKDLPVIVMTNFCCASAGDMLTKYLGEHDNVIVVGMTYSNNSAQATGGKCILPDNMSFHFPSQISLDKDEQIEIDTGADRKARIPLDYIIPVDEELAKKLFESDFSNGDDYELEYVLENYADIQ